MSHVVLLGDSVFDNASYVPGEPPVIEQLMARLGNSWRATLLAVDGAITSNVNAQLSRVPKDATHLIVSAGGNDALWSSPLVQMENISARAAFDQLASVRRDFQRNYQEMVQAVLALHRPAVFCTVYDAIPGLGEREKTGLSIFNDVIISSAIHAACPLLDLRAVCHESRDYSPLSPIEPSARGGEKIARAIQHILLNHSFQGTNTVVYTS